MTILCTILHINFDEACMKEKTNRGKMQKLCIRGQVYICEEIYGLVGQRFLIDHELYSIEKYTHA
jgi:hypothetical protein